MEGEFLDDSPVTYSEIFDAHEPFYISIGMTPGEYWNGEAQLTKKYRKAYELERERENHKLWLQGLYIYEALIDASPLYHDFMKGKPEPLPYSKEPYPLTDKEARERAEREERIRIEKQKAMVEAWAKRVNSQIKDSNNG